MRLRSVVASAVLAAVLGAPAVAQAAGPFELTIRRTAHGIPHVLANDWASLGYGSAYTEALDNVCPLADVYLTVDAQRSRFLGPDGVYAVGGNGTKPKNVDSDIFFQKAIDQGVVEALVNKPPPAGPSADLKEIARGYTAGYNAALKEMNAPEGVTNNECRGKPWVRPITEMTVWRRFYQLAVIASSGVALDGIAQATPPGGARAASTTAARTAAQQEALTSPELAERLGRPLGGIGSNAVAFGKTMTANKGGLLLGNPHFPWYGSERFYEKHLTIPGKIDVAGGSLLGVPIVNIGFTRGLAWSHTVSTARRFLPYELKLVPGSPTTYLVDGQPKQMKATKVTIQAKQADGSLKPVTRTLYDTEYGPILTSILGLPVFPWTPERAYALNDANLQFRLLEHFFRVNKAQDVPALDTIERELQGIPWVNTIATDKAGRAYYTDIGAVPNLDIDKQAACQVPLGVTLDQTARVQVVDGSRSSCAPGQAAGARAPGILPVDRQPTLQRDDYVTNSNDSYWLTNPQQPLEGFPRIQGDERTARAPRTRIGLIMSAERKDWTPKQLMDMVFNNRQYVGELWKDEAVAMCRSMAGQVPGEACDALAMWDKKDDLESRGAILFRRFAQRALGVPGGPWAVPFDANDPVNTPRGLNTGNAAVRSSLVNAVRDLQGAGIGLAQPIREVQKEPRGGIDIPIHGGPGTAGVFNAVNFVFDPKRGYPRTPHGSSYVQVVAPGDRCPDAHAILTYSQSTDPTSPYYSDQTKMYSQKQWVKWAFCEADVRKGTIERREVGGGFLGLTARRGARGSVLLKAQRAGTARVTFKKRGVRKLVRTVRLSAGRSVRVTPKLRRRGAYRATVVLTGRDGDVATRRLTVRKR